MRASYLLLLAATAACGASASGDGMPADGASAGGGAGGLASATGAMGGGGTSAAGGSSATGGTAAAGGAAGAGGVGDSGGAAAAGGTLGTGGRSSPGRDAGSGRADASAGGAGGDRGTGGSTDVRGTDAGPEDGAGVRPDLLADKASDGRGDGGGDARVGGDAITSDGAPCPQVGHITYTLAKAANPTADQQGAYTAIAAAMDQAVAYYNCYTNITKALRVSYDTSVATADGNVNGSIRFGADRAYMVLRVATHEIAHTVGVGQNASSNWLSFVNIPAGGSSGSWTGAKATTALRAITAKATDTLTADHDHFWPYGLNRDTDPHAEPDIIAHCRIVMALREDLGLD